VVIKVVGLQIKDLSKLSSKYKPQAKAMPPRSAVFDMSEEHKQQHQTISGSASLSANPNSLAHMRADGKQLISLPMSINPVALAERLRKRLNEGLLKEMKDQRTKYKPNEKLEGDAMKRLWT
jgi:hypothetical protein